MKYSVSKRFRKAYVVEKGRLHVDSEESLQRYAEEIVYILTGTEKAEEIAEALRSNFFEFNPDCDVIIPTGRVISSFLLGRIMRWIPTFYVGVYSDKNHNFMKIRSEH